MKDFQVKVFDHFSLFGLWVTYWDLFAYLKKKTIKCTLFLKVATEKAQYSYSSTELRYCQ